MAFLGLVLVLLSLGAIAEATELKFSKIKGQIYAETDEEHFAIFGPVKGISDDVVRIVSVDKKGHYLVDLKCDRKWADINKVPSERKREYGLVRDRFLAEKRGPEESPNSYTWSDTFSSDQKEFRVIKLDEDTVAYSSQYFPSKLARVIISGPVVTFVHYDGTVRIKTMDCLYINERILINGIEKIDPEAKKSLFSSAGDNVLRKYLKNNPFDESDFDSEQDYSKTYTNARIAAMQRAIMGDGVRAIDGWGP